jgi:hypothetical protein
MIIEKAAQKPANCVRIVRILFLVPPIYHSYNPIKKGKRNIPVIIMPMLK